jgi:hypothetical protein
LQTINTTWGEARRKAQDRTRWKETVVALCPQWDEMKYVKSKDRYIIYIPLYLQLAGYLLLYDPWGFHSKACFVM